VTDSIGVDPSTMSTFRETFYVVEMAPGNYFAGDVDVAGIAAATVKVRLGSVSVPYSARRVSPTSPYASTILSQIREVFPKARFIEVTGTYDIKPAE
jgi:hypothetical protein